jgi:non-heme chloroperoxidase
VAAVTEHFTEASGTRIRYLDNGGTGPELPIVFSPGLTDTADEYEAVLEYFAPRRMVVIEVRGRGASSAPTSGFSAAHHADDLRAAIAHAGIDRFHLMTFSRGTTWGLDLFLSDPSRVVSVSIGDYWASEKGLGIEVADHMLTTRFRGRPLTERIERRVITELFRESTDRDLHAAVAAARVPTLVAHGTGAGRLADDQALARYRAEIPGVEIVVIEGAGHDLFRPDRLAYPRAVSEFIERRAPRT